MSKEQNYDVYLMALVILRAYQVHMVFGQTKPAFIYPLIGELNDITWDQIHDLLSKLAPEGNEHRVSSLERLKHILALLIAAKEGQASDFRPYVPIPVDQADSEDICYRTEWPLKELFFLDFPEFTRRYRTDGKLVQYTTLFEKPYKDFYDLLKLLMLHYLGGDRKELLEVADKDYEQRKGQ